MFSDLATRRDRDVWGAASWTSPPGTINTDAGFGPWTEGEALLEEYGGLRWRTRWWSAGRGEGYFKSLKNWGRWGTDQVGP